MLTCPDNLPEMVNTAKADIQEMQHFFRNWDPKLRALLSIVQETSKWRLLNSEEMNTWSHSSGTFALLGDACHATLPNLAQGAAMAVEDGAVMGLLFEKLENGAQLKDILVIYERIRKARTTRIVKASTDYRDTFTCATGPGNGSAIGSCSRNLRLQDFRIASRTRSSRPGCSTTMFERKWRRHGLCISGDSSPAPRAGVPRL